MLCAHTHFRSGPVDMHFDLVFQRRFQLFAVARTETVFDSSFCPPAERDDAVSSGRVGLYIVLDGVFRWTLPDTLAVRDRGALVAPAEFLIGAGGKRTRDFVTGGPIFRGLEFYFRAEDVCEAPTGPRRVVLSDATMEAACAYASFVHSGAHRDRAERVSLLRALLDGLVRDHVLHASALYGLVLEETGHEVVWNQLMAWLEPLELNGSLETLAERVGLSLRQTTRRLESMMATFAFPWYQWRTLTRSVRMRLAVLLLSNPELSITDIARTTGYAGVQSLAHALQAAGLPSPSDVRQQLLARHFAEFFRSGESTNGGGSLLLS